MLRGVIMRCFSINELVAVAQMSPRPNLVRGGCGQDLRAAPLPREQCNVGPACVCVVSVEPAVLSLLLCVVRSDRPNTTCYLGLHGDDPPAAYSTPFGKQTLHQRSLYFPE
jgi:hypothetical protein